MTQCHSNPTTLGHGIGMNLPRIMHIHGMQPNRQSSKNGDQADGNECGDEEGGEEKHRFVSGLRF